MNLQSPEKYFLVIKKIINAKTYLIGWYWHSFKSLISIFDSTLDFMLVRNPLRKSIDVFPNTRIFGMENVSSILTHPNPMFINVIVTIT